MRLKRRLCISDHHSSGVGILSLTSIQLECRAKASAVPSCFYEGLEENERKEQFFPFLLF